MVRASSAGVPGLGSRPCLPSMATTSGASSAFTSSRFSRSMIAFGVFAGATKAYQFIASKPG